MDHGISIGSKPLPSLDSASVPKGIISVNGTTLNIGGTQSGIKRARAQLNCVPCRQGKLKCNRASPACDQCIKRSREDICMYLPPPRRTKQSHGMKGRIKDLERMVVDLISTNASLKEQPTDTEKGSSPNGSNLSHSEQENAITPAPGIDDVDGTLGKMKGGSKETQYVSSAHWTAILDKITEVKQQLEDDDEQDQEDIHEPPSDACVVSLGKPERLSRRELLDHLPPKSECDRLLSLWFNSSDPFHHIIHRPTFLATYSKLWVDPSDIPIFWIGLLYSGLCIGVHLDYRFQNDITMTLPPEAIESVFRYQKLAATAIALGDTSKPQPYIIECLIFYVQSEFTRKKRHHSGIWLTLGLIIRLALRMGYHRDADHYSSVTVFDGEIRRRVWHLLYQLDILISFAVGMPSMILHIESDTKPPSNLLDSDFSPDAIKLPPARPENERTPVTYLVAKSRIAKIFGEAAQLSNSIKPTSHSKVIELDNRLQEAYQMIPSILRLRSMEDSILDPPELLMNRFNLEFLYQKTRCVLHRNYIANPSFNDPEILRSHRICVEAAFQVLVHQETVFSACQPGGQLHNVWWYMISLTTYDFLLAATIICLWCDNLNKYPKMVDRLAEYPDVARGKALLLTSYRIWNKYGTYLAEAKKAALLLRALIAKLTRCVDCDYQFSNLALTELSLNPPTQPSSISPESLSESDIVPTSPYNSGFLLPEDVQIMTGIADIPLDINWDTWDNHITGRNEFAGYQQPFWDNQIDYGDPEYLNILRLP